MWCRARVRACDGPELPWHTTKEWPTRVIQNTGTGLTYQGESGWSDYTVSLRARAEFGGHFGVIVNVRGLFRHVGLTLSDDGVARLVERYDATETVLAGAACPSGLFKDYEVSITTRRDGRISALVNGVALAGRTGEDRARGAAGMLVREGNCSFGPMSIRPAG